MIIFYNKKIQIKDDNWNTEKDDVWNITLREVMNIHDI